MARPLLLVSFFCIASTANSDTITTRDNQSLNGRAEYKNGEFTLYSQFPGGKAATIRISRSDVDKIELNGNDFNQGGPPALDTSTD